jgi:hypothetical protein
MRRLRQRIENRSPSFGIFTRRELAGRFVIREVGVLAFPARALELDGLAVEQDPLGAVDPLAELGRFAGDDDAPFFDPTLDLSPRTKA